VASTFRTSNNRNEEEQLSTWVEVGSKMRGGGAVSTSAKMDKTSVGAKLSTEGGDHCTEKPAAVK